MGESLLSRGESREWLVAHEALSRLARERAAADAEEGRWLLAAFRARVHLQLGLGGFSEYVERLFGYKPRSTQEKLRVAEALEGLPALAHALEHGELHWSLVREITRVAVSDTEREWRDFARGKTLRQVEASVAGKRSGDLPAARSDPALLRHVLRVEMSAEALALFREARSELRRRSGGALDDEAVLLEMARSVLRGPKDEGRASYQIALRVCPDCGAGQQAANGELLRVGQDVVEMARCDAQQVAMGLRAEAGDPMPSEPNAPAGARAKQTIPPALRRAALQRDQRRCRVPGCNNASFLDLHHIQRREDGGANSADNLLTLCGVHHRAVHRGVLSIAGSSRAASFRHADGSSYGAPTNPRALDVCARVFSGLRNLGFREAEAQRALAEARADVRGEPAVEPTAEQLLRAALVRLGPRSRARRDTTVRPRDTIREFDAPTQFGIVVVPRHRSPRPATRPAALAGPACGATPALSGHILAPLDAVAAPSPTAPCAAPAPSPPGSVPARLRSRRCAATDRKTARSLGTSRPDRHRR